MSFGKNTVMGAVALALALTALAGCTGLPARGPQSDSIDRADVKDGEEPYLMVKVSPAVLPHLKGHPTETIAGRMDSRAPTGSAVPIGIGDILAISIFEAAQGGLFIPATAGSRPGNFIDLPPQAVSRAGTIAVPYAGDVKVSNRTIPQIQQDIVAKLRQRAIEPQVVVSLKEQRATQVSVLGQVNTPARLAINQGGERLLDAIARAGGPKYPGHESFVILQRGGKQARVLFDQLVKSPQNNIWVQPNDTIYVTHEPRVAHVFGATDKNGQIKFDAESLSLADALAKSGGLADAAAEPAAVYVYRLEPRGVLKAMEVDPDRFKSQVVPVIYQVDLRDPSGFFHATRFPLRDKDLIYVANAKTVEITKFLQFVRVLTATIREPIRANNDVVSPPILN